MAIKTQDKPKSRHLTIYLLSENLKKPLDALAKPGNLKKHPLKSSAGVKGDLFITKSQGKAPKWYEFVDDYVKTPLDETLNKSASGVLLLQVGGRGFAVTFGPAGRYCLKPDSWEPDFGLRATLNAVDADQLRSVDIRTIEELTLSTRRQVSRASSLDTFGLDVSRDLLRAVTGEPKDSALAARVTGADALALSVRMNLPGLKEKCEQFLKLFKSDAYKERFGWIDDLKALKPGKEVDAVDQQLVETLRKSDTAKTHLAPDELISWDEAAEFYYSNDPSQTPHLDLAVEDYLASLEDPSSLSLSTLKKSHRISVRRSDQEEAYSRWWVYNCLVFETFVEGNLYVLSGGQWFKVAATLADQINSDLAKWVTPTLSLPAANVKEGEDAYIKRAVIGRADLGMLHTNLAYSLERRSKIEVCDIFTKERQFVHVKQKTKSATLSHLFAQGFVSLQGFLYDAKFRSETRSKLESLDPQLAALIPVDKAADTQEFEVVYAIMTNPTSNLPAELPFFSRLNLMKVGEQIRRAGCRVSVLRIDQKSK